MLSLGPSARTLRADDDADASACGAGGAVYGLGFVGAAVYYIQQATTFWGGAWGLLKALLWPGFLVYEALGSMGA